MPTPPRLLDPKLPQLPSGPPVAKTAVAAKSAATNFRQALAASPPVNADGPKGAMVQAARTPLPQLPAIPAQVVADLSQRVSSIAENSGTAKRLKKALEQEPAAAAAPAAALQLSAAVPPSAAQSSTAGSKTAASPGIPVLAAAVSAVRTPDSSLPAAPPPNLPFPAMSSAAPVEPGLVISTYNPKHSPAVASEKAALMPTVSTNIQPENFSPAAANPAQAWHGSAKSADISRQIAAALPRNALSTPGSPQPLHISLTPENLGTITIKIAQHASGETLVTLTASQPETLAALKEDAQHLHQLLTNAGIPEANRQVDFRTMPVTATQNSPGLDRAGGQSGGGQSGGGQAAGGEPGGGLLAGGQLGQGNGNTQQQQAGTAFASSVARPVAARAVDSVARPGSHHASGVDVIA